MKVIDNDTLLVENEDYMFLPHPTDDNLYSVKIMNGEFMGIEYSYNVIRITEEAESAKFTFSYVVQEDLDILNLKNPSEKIEFENHLGLILHSILSNIESENEYKVINDNRKDHNQKYNSE